MITSVIVYCGNDSAAHRIKAVLVEHGLQTEMMEFHPERPNQECYLAILARQPDLVFVLDFAGFSMHTDTGDIAYINLTCRNVHLITVDRAKDFDTYLTKKLSMAMLFYCRSEAVFQKLRTGYPNIPYLRYVSDWHEMVADVLREAEPAGK